jgi:VWFA-related protein
MRRLPAGSQVRRALKAATFLSMLLLPVPSPAQVPPQAGVRESVTVRAAEIEVLVLDSNGRPVTDLTREEFLLTVDGAPRKIDWVLPPAPPPKLPETAAEPEAHPAQSGASAPVGAAPAHSTVFFVDDFHLSFRSRSMGLNALKVYLAALPPKEEAALYSFRHRLEILQRFTVDRAALSAALDRLGRTSPVAMTLNSRAEWAGRSEGALQSLSQMLQALAGRPESKTVVVLADYLPATSWELANPLGTSSAFDFAAAMKQDAHDAYLARATIVALDPSGIHPFGAGADQSAAASILPSTPSGAATASLSGDAQDSFQAPQAGHMEAGGDAFAVLARETGGARISNTNRLPEDLAAEVELLNARYRLGFTPDSRSSETRRVSVRVTRAGLRVRMAAGQGSLLGDSLARARFAAALLSSSLRQADFPIRVEMVKAPKGWVDKTLSLEIKIPVRELFVEDRGETLQGRVEILVTTEDNQGGVGEVQREAVAVQVAKKDAARAEHAFFRLPLTLHVEGKGTLLVGVRDTTTNRLGHATLSYPK